MQITLENASDVVKLLDIVNVFMTVHDGHKAELEAYLDKIDELKQEVCDKDVISNGYLCEINQMCGMISDLEKEIKCLSTLNSELSMKIDRIKTQQSCDESYVVSGVAIDDLRAELKATIEENDRHKEEIRYLLELQTKLCEVVKRRYPLFDFDRWVASYEKEKARIKKEQQKAKKHEINWNKIQEEAKNERTDNQST